MKPANKPSPAEPVAETSTKPATTKPVVTSAPASSGKPATTRRRAVRPVTSKPAETKAAAAPVVVAQAVTEPAIAEPVAVEPVVVEAVVARSAEVPVAVAPVAVVARPAGVPEVPAPDVRGKKKAAGKKPKLVRDSFTMPENEYQQIFKLKQCAVQGGRAVKKSELLRAGLAALSAMSVDQLLEIVNSLETIKTGRPAK